VIPHEYLLPYLISNAIALALLGLAFRRPVWVRWASITIFLWAAFTNGRIAMTSPLDYQTFGDLTWSSLYRAFIEGWFREHTAWLLLPIAAGQLVIAFLFLSNTSRSRRLATVGAVVFLLAIVPLGVGSAFPFSLTYGLALVLMSQRFQEAETTVGQGATRRNRITVLGGNRSSRQR
jgi:hypothetical protein